MRILRTKTKTSPTIPPGTFSPSIFLAADSENQTLQEIPIQHEKETLRYLLWILAGISTVLCLFFSLLLIRKHLKNLTRPREQRKIIGILYLAPVFAVDSFLSISFPEMSQLFGTLKEVYEGYSVYLFFSLLVEYLGGEKRSIELLKLRFEPLYRPYPLRKLCCPQPLDPEPFFNGSKLGVMQFVVVRPLMGFVALILWSFGLYTKGDFRLDQGYFYIEMINNISVSWAVYCLLRFFVAMRRNLQPFDPVPKFLAIKVIVFLCFWQGVLLAVLAKFNVIQEVGSWTIENVKTGIQDILVCFEMLLVSFYHRYAFPWQVYDRGRHTEISVGLDENFALSDATRDFSQIIPSQFFVGSPKQTIHAGDDQDEIKMEEISAAKKDIILEGEQPLLRDEDE